LAVRDTFEGYKLTLIHLPAKIPEELRLEIFRRINEGGTPLSAQDIRLAYYGTCKSVWFVRLAGVYDSERQGAARMIETAKTKYGLSWPWSKVGKEVQGEWKNWWEGRERAMGQAASEMFLWFIIAKHRNKVNGILSDENYLRKGLSLAFSGRVEEVADVACAELRREDNSEDARMLCSADEMRDKYFPLFATWWEAILSNIPSIGVDKSRRLAFLMAGLSWAWKKPVDSLSEETWELIDQFLKSPRDIDWDGLGIEYPEAKGKWTGKKGLYAQIDAIYSFSEAVCKKS